MIEVREDEEEGVSSYGMTLRKREDFGNWKRKHWIALCRELALCDAMGLSYDRPQIEWMNE